MKKERGRYKKNRLSIYLNNFVLFGLPDDDVNYPSQYLDDLQQTAQK